jgi:hypothetical protein
MAAEPIPIPQDSTQVDIDQYGNITGLVEIKNSGVVKFDVTKYGIDPNTGHQGNVCIITLTSANVNWSTSPDAGENTIKVGNG